MPDGTIVVDENLAMFCSITGAIIVAILDILFLSPRGFMDMASAAFWGLVFGAGAYVIFAVMTKERL